ncbi:ribonuclease [Streptomyces sp. V2I9]|uniref:ribonuclease n=1 Tax=Streptomyces sp. V2I9 TaxID=3042304 RepID=UPI0027855D6C|nr:ribonuclease [Streptomyces sp. V2I9]MDQ0987848.1 ribonuclease T1 [Streptomyces sp. V2I9]
MRIPPRITRFGGAAALLSLLIASAPITAQAATANTTTTVSHPASAFRAAAVGSICYSALPSQAHDTLDLIERGGPFPYEQDGTVFQNREGLLPDRSTGYYHEYTVITPGSDHRGARRIVTGEQHEEDYYTADHYASFDLVDHGC